MAREVFYRKYRSKGFADIAGQEHVTRTLRNAVRSGRLSHAYLFCGPRGVGKTSAARVLAKAVNCLDPQDGEPCHKCQACVTIAAGRCMDIIEIDAASNNSVDDIRDLREKVGYSPSEVRMKFYILDEAHMLSSSACNAILKTLEEPPPHATFILATTETEKILPTILSRCQRFDFRRIPLREVAGRLRFICEQEELQIGDDVLEYIGRLATGSLRDAESLLDQMVTYFGTTMTLEQVQMAIGTTGSDAALQLAGMVVQGDTPAALRMVNQALADGVDLRQLNRSTLEALRGVMMVKLTGEPVGLLEITVDGRQELVRLAEILPAPKLLDIVRIFSQVEGAQRGAFPPQLPLELAIADAALVRDAPAVAKVADAPAAKPQYRTEPAPSTPGRPTRPEPPAMARSEPVQPQATTPAPPAIVNQPAELVDAGPVSDRGELSLDKVRAVWPQALANLGSRSQMIQSLVRECELVEATPDEVTLAFRFKYHRDRIEDSANRRMVEQALAEALGAVCRVRCVIQANRTDNLSSPSDDPIVRAALSMGARIQRVVDPGSASGTTDVPNQQ